MPKQSIIFTEKSLPKYFLKELDNLYKMQQKKKKESTVERRIK